MEIFRTFKMKNYWVVQSCLVISLVSFTAWLTSAFFQKNKRREQNDNDQIMRTPLIIITGCDTGLGYSIVMRYLNNGHFNRNQHCNKMIQIPMLNYNKIIIPKNIAIVAFCLNPSGSGAKRLLELSQQNNNIKLFIRQLDLTNADSITKGITFVTDLLDQSFDENCTNNEIKYYKIQALINNAARMVMAEYEWQTPKLIQQQFEINVLGPIMLTKHLLPKLRLDKSRVINITSHCVHLPLPGISVYGATKAALHAWTIGSRIELENHGVRMIKFSPGSFFRHSSIMSGKQRTVDYTQMRDQMNNEQLAYYGTYIDAYQNYLSYIDTCDPEETIPENNKIYYEMDNALWTAQPKMEYSVSEPWRYRIYYALASTLSTLGLHSFKDKIVRSFVATPKFQNCTIKKKESP